MALYNVFSRPFIARSGAVAFAACGMAVGGACLLALAAASHSGEPMHVDRAFDMLERARLTEDDLGCPPALPLGSFSWCRLVASKPMSASVGSGCRSAGGRRVIGGLGLALSSRAVGHLGVAYHGEISHGSGGAAAVAGSASGRAARSCASAARLR